MPRILRIGCSLAIVLVAHWAYRLLAVPRIDPPAASRGRDQVSAEDYRKAQEDAENDPRRRALLPLFQPGDWELGDRAKILESEHGKLLVEDWSNQQDKQVELRPCTMIFTPASATGDEEERLRSAIVLQAPQGALLEFDQPLDLRHGNIGRLKKGTLRGAITIRSTGRLPTPDDDLRVLTSDVELTDEGIWTPNDVDFRFGANYGRGGQMKIRFTPPATGTADKKYGMNVGGIESLELYRLERLHLQPDSMPRRARPADAARPTDARPTDPHLAEALRAPIEIGCRGPFRFDFGQQLATFEEQVDVRRMNPRGPEDRILCDRLGVQFSRRRTDAKPTAAGRDSDGERPSMGELQPSVIEASGHPVTLQLPSQEADGHGDKLEYHIASGRIVLEARPNSEPAFLRRGLQQIHSPRMEYNYEGPGRLGRARADGPGRIRVELRGRNRQPMEARWDREMLLGRDQEQPLITLRGDVQLNYGVLGTLAAPEIYFWLLEPQSAGAEDPRRLAPDRMLAYSTDPAAVRPVRFGSAKVSGKIGRLEVWFERQDPSPASPSVDAPPSAAPLAAVSRTSLLAADLAKRMPESLQTVLRPVPGQSDSIPGQHFEVESDLLQVQMVTQGEQGEPAALMARGQVRLLESQTARPEEKPLLVSGDRVQVFHATRPYRSVSVTGSPAHIEARGMNVEGSNINLNSGTNRMWMDGPGRLDLLVGQEFSLLDAGPAARRPTAPMPLNIEWQEGMATDGRTLRFVDSVVASTPEQSLRTATLELEFQQPIRFTEMQRQTKPVLEKLRCRGGVIVEGRSLDPQTRQPLSRERMEAADLSVALLSGAVQAAGPGRATTLRRGSTEMLAAQMGGMGPGSAPAKPEGAKSGLIYLCVTFERGLAGNFQQHKMTFSDHVRAIYGPVATWEGKLDPDQQESWGPSGVAMKCDQLSVAQVAVPGKAEPAIELEAVGNALVEGQSFTARGARMSYAESKGLLILEGDGRNDAQLFRQEQVGAPISTTSARRFFYWPARRQFDSEGMRRLEHQIAAPKPPAR